MNKDQKAKLFSELKMLAAILSADVTREVFQAYVEMLSDYEFSDCKKAIKWAATNCKFFPKPVELIERIKPKPTREDGGYLAGLAIECINRFGYHQSRAAKEYMGNEAWNAVQMTGGWDVLCNTPKDQLGSLRAQLRDNAVVSANTELYQKRSHARIEHALAKQIGLNNGDPKQLKNLIEFPNQKPGEKNERK